MKTLSIGSTPYSDSIIHVDDDELIVEERSNTRVLQKIVDQTTELRNHGVVRMKDMQPAARIPIVVWGAWKKEWRLHHADKWEWMTYLVMKINSRENSKFLLQDKRL